jgi:hypothetical protein
MSHLGDKMKQFAQGTQSLMSTLEASVDAGIAKQNELKDRATKAINTQQQVLADTESGIAEVETALSALTNQ